jgi:hypothetical protein
VPPVAHNLGVPLCRDRITAAGPDVQDMLASLLTPAPVAARGVAAASLLLTDGAGPVYNRHSSMDLVTAVREVVAQLDPGMPLIVPT